MKIFWILSLLFLIVGLNQGYHLDDLPLIKPGEYLRSSVTNYEQKYFKIRKEDLKPNEKYEVRVSFQGNVGAEMTLKWTNTEDVAFHNSKNTAFRPLDTANLFFHTNEKSEIKEAHQQSIRKSDDGTYYEFFVFMYRNSLARSRELFEKPVEFYITILPVIIPGLGYNVLWAYLLAIAITIVIVCFVLPKCLSKIPFYNSFLTRDYNPIVHKD